jgi:hypothetical protein
MLHVRIHVPPHPGALEAVAEGLVRLNEWLFSQAETLGGIELPPLYESGIVYRREPKGREWWESAADALGVTSERSGDCEDLSAFRCAELRYYEGTPCRVKVIRNRRGNFHAVVEYGDGEIEDPSRVLVDLEHARKARRR